MTARNLINESLATPHSYHEARIQLPLNAKWSSSFGNAGEGGYTEFWRTPEGVRYTISNGPWHLIECEFDWHCQRVEERA